MCSDDLCGQTSASSSPGLGVFGVCLGPKLVLFMRKG
jgi:hypothetical protein